MNIRVVDIRTGEKHKLLRMQFNKKGNVVNLTYSDNGITLGVDKIENFEIIIEDI